MVVSVANSSWRGGIEKKNINIHILVILVTKLGAFPHRNCVHARNSLWTEPRVPISARERWVRSADASLFLVFYFFSSNQRFVGMVSPNRALFAYCSRYSWWRV